MHLNKFLFSTLSGSFYPTAAPTTPETTPTASPLSFKDPNLKAFNDTAGFTVVYPAQARNLSPESCSSDGKTYTPKETNIPIIIVENTAKKTGYITFKTTNIVKSKQIEPGVYQGVESCSVRQTDLNLIENGSEGTGVEKQFPGYAKFAYATINSDKDLVGLAQKTVVIGTCQINEKVKTAEEGVYTVKFTCPNKTNEGPYDESGYFTMKYSEKKKLAVIWTAHQQAVFFEFNGKVYDDKVDILF